MNAILSNPFKAGLLQGEAQIGLWLSSTSSYMAEIAATSGYDWLLIDGEHAPNTIQDLYHQLQAIAPYASQPVIRPVEGNRSLIKQVLDIGARTLLIPMVDTAEQAREIVSATRYPPLGPPRGGGRGQFGPGSCSGLPAPRRWAPAGWGPEWPAPLAGDGSKTIWRRPTMSCAC